MDPLDFSLPPSIPAKCRAIFQKKVQALPPEGFPILRGQVQQYLTSLRAAAMSAQTPYDIGLVERLAAVLLELLAEPARFPEEHQALLVGAARYFLETSDSNDDLKDPWGFDDDLAVLNTVLLVVGRHDLVIRRDPAEPVRGPRPKG